MRRLVQIAERSAAPEAAEPSPASPESADALVRLKAMYDEWVEVARVAVTRRADLIRLGILRRRRPSKGSEASEDEATPTPPPVAVAVAPVVAVTPGAVSVTQPIYPAPANGSNGSPTNGVSVAAPSAPLPS